jgi:hypothetical protein
VLIGLVPGAGWCHDAIAEKITRTDYAEIAAGLWLAASASGHLAPLTAGEIASWRAAGPELLPRLWQHLRRCGTGEAAAGITAERQLA